MARVSYAHHLGKRVRIDLDDGTQEYGVVEAITTRGHKIKLDDGRVVYRAWWRITLVD